MTLKTSLAHNKVLSFSLSQHWTELSLKHVTSSKGVAINYGEAGGGHKMAGGGGGGK